MLSNSSKYAIKAVLFLAINSSEKQRIMVKDIYKAVNVSEAYLAKLLQELARRNIISSIRGPKGGFYITEKEKEQSLLEIIKVIDGENRIHSCVLGVSDCDMNNPCLLHNLVASSKMEFLRSFETTTIAELTKNLGKDEVFFPL
ncbi:RrF2 family transcriptional regulator [Eudoraea chungangensis]|uniref:RrF2 family transcriptional regulator n=1 Tax=Eudoraea chungangensis TaxID=1481905 RepID=UPI0023EC769F|nr:Rrf2 family transcriptional regulator [Eudoraea chungangensis]